MYTLMNDLRCIYLQFLHFETVYSGTLTARRCDVDESINQKGMLLYYSEKSTENYIPT